MEFIYKCPVCGQKLELVKNSFSCVKKHSFDLSREGYVNLLLANQKKTKDPGDSAFMVGSRKMFLEKGFYEPLSEEINKIIINLATETGSNRGFNILDVGSGIGYYCGRLEESIKKTGTLNVVRNSIGIWGIDISRPAIQKAAKKFPGIQFCVGSSFNLPYLDETFDVIYSIFSPFENRELSRVLRPGGKILVVRPGENHLKELSTLIYGKSQLQGKPVDLLKNPELVPVRENRLKYEIGLDNNTDIMNLVAMTPYYWHLNDDNKMALARLTDFKATLDFQISILIKNIF